MFLENNYVTVVKLKKSIHDYFEKTKTKISKFQRSRKKNMIEIKMLLKSKLAIREKKKKKKIAQLIFSYTLLSESMSIANLQQKDLYTREKF